MLAGTVGYTHGLKPVRSSSTMRDQAFGSGGQGLQPVALNGIVIPTWASDDRRIDMKHET